MIKELKARNRPSREQELQEAEEGPVLYLPVGKWIGSFLTKFHVMKYKYSHFFVSDHDPKSYKLSNSNLSIITALKSRPEPDAGRWHRVG